MAMSRAPGTCSTDGGGCAVEIDLGIGEVGQDPDALALAEVDDRAVEIEIDDLRRRVRRVVQHQRQRLRHRVLHRALERRQEFGERRAARHRDVAHRAAGDDEAVGMDRIARVGHQHDVARRGDRLREIGQALLRAQRDDDLALGIELDVEAALVIGRLRLAQAGDAARRRIAVGARVGGGLDQLGDDVRRGRQVGIAHAEIDHVLAGGAGACLHGVHFREDVGRQALQAVKFRIVHPVLPWWAGNRSRFRRAGWPRCRADVA